VFGSDLKLLPAAIQTGSWEGVFDGLSERALVVGHELLRFEVGKLHLEELQNLAVETDLPGGHDDREHHDCGAVEVCKDVQDL